MAHARLGNTEQSRRYFDKGVRWIADNKDVDWKEELEGQLLKREAQSLIDEF